VHTLGVISEEFDQTGLAPRGVNIVLIDPAGANPAVNLTLRNLPLKRVLDFIVDSVGYQYEVQADAVVVRAGGEKSALDTQFFPVSRSTVLRMTGQAAAPKEGAGEATGAVGSGAEQEGERIRAFLQLAGATFDGVEGATLAFDGSQLIVTQTPRNLERIRNILTRYNDVRQVEIEAKFMEVQQGALEELGVQWNLATKASQQNAGAQARYQTGGGINRTLSDAFRNATTNQQISVTGPGLPDGGIRLDTSAPQIPGGVLLGTGAAALANVSTIIGEFDVNAIVRALSQKSGTELLSAPKLTVLSGNPATITVAQELRYPQSYGEIQSQVGTGSVSGGGSAGVSITSGTPQEFTTRNVGVELRVTPTVEEDDHSVSLDLNPKVTEFEGFVEYGGPSIAISGGTTVTVPPGFYQPIFSVREVTTKVTIWDGATLVMGGLTREDVKKVNDKVPVFGSLPLVGRLFRSQGESSQKRNLLIFVTANLVSPGGSPKKQQVADAPAGSLFQNPTIVTPAGTAERK
jgi:general secretion pathway protein D